MVEGCRGVRRLDTFIGLGGVQGVGLMLQVRKIEARRALKMDTQFESAPTPPPHLKP